MATRKNAQPRHALSKKFTPYAQYEVEDLLRFRTTTPYSSCLIRNPTMKPLGRVRRGIWYVLQEYYTTRKGIRRRKEVRVIEILIKNKLGREFTPHERLHQTCTTTGCLHMHHYEIRENKDVINYDQVLTIYETALEKGELTIPIGDSKKARTLRLACYPHKKAMKMKNPQVYEQIHEMFELVVREGDLICRRKGFSSDIQAAWAAAGLPSQSNASKQEEQLSKAMDQLREQEAAGDFDTDPMTTLLKKQKEGRDAATPPDSNPDSA